MSDRVMNLRYAGVCTQCGEKIPQGVKAVYSPATRSVRHVACTGDGHGHGGGSAMREFERRSLKDAQRVQAEKDQVQQVFGQGLFGCLASLVFVDTSTRTSTTVWQQGAVGEQVVAAALDELAGAGVVALHDRRIPYSRANIDHIAVTPWGVWVIDTKRYVDKEVEVCDEDGVFWKHSDLNDHLKVGGRRCDRLVDGLLHQCELVRTFLGATVPVQGALCFVESIWARPHESRNVRQVRVLWPKRLAHDLVMDAPPVINVDPVVKDLAVHFPAAG